MTILRLRDIGLFDEERVFVGASRKYSLLIKVLLANRLIQIGVPLLSRHEFIRDRGIVQVIVGFSDVISS